MGKRFLNKQHGFDVTKRSANTLVARMSTRKRVGVDCSKYFRGSARQFHICNVPVDFDSVVRYTSVSPLGNLRGKRLATWNPRTKVELVDNGRNISLLMNDIFICNMFGRGSRAIPFSGSPSGDIDFDGVKIKAGGNVVFSLFRTTSLVGREELKRTLEMVIFEKPQSIGGWNEEEDM